MWRKTCVIHIVYTHCTFAQTCGHRDIRSACACARCASARRAKALHLPQGEHCIGASVESNCGGNVRGVLATNCEALALQASGSCDDFFIEFGGVSNSGLV